MIVITAPAIAPPRCEKELNNSFFCIFTVCEFHVPYLILIKEYKAIN
jgi:hypothetical protein